MVVPVYVQAKETLVVPAPDLTKLPAPEIAVVVIIIVPALSNVISLPEAVTIPPVKVSDVVASIVADAPSVIVPVKVPVPEV